MRPPRRIEMSGQAAAAFESFDRQARGEVDVLHAKARRVGIAADSERVVAMAEEIRPKVTGNEADAGGVRDGGVGGHALAARAEFAGDDRADAGELAVVVGPGD